MPAVGGVLLLRSHFFQGMKQIQGINLTQAMTVISELHDIAPYPALRCVWRKTPRGPSSSTMFHALIAEVDMPLVCIQCLWILEAEGVGIELTAFFKGRGRYSAILLGGIHGDGERRVLGGSCPPFLEVAIAKAIGEEVARCHTAELYFPGCEYPNDRFYSWLELPLG